MNKPAKPETDDVDDLSDLYGGPPPTEAEMDAWIAANLDEINASIARADKEFAEGKAEPWDFEKMLAEAKAEFRKSRQG